MCRVHITGHACKQINVTFADCFRKLSVLENWRLMGFKDDDYYKAKAVGVGESQLKKQAGNSIAVPVMEAVFKELLKSS
jgi:DNA (cytosine-5)-methyltransferase 1